MHGTKQQTCRPYEMPLTRSNFDLNFSFPFCIYLDRKITILFLLFPPPPPFSSLFSYHVITVNETTMILRLDYGSTCVSCRLFSCLVMVKKELRLQRTKHTPIKVFLHAHAVSSKNLYVYNFLPYNCHIILYFLEIEWSIRLNWL